MCADKWKGDGLRTWKDRTIKTSSEQSLTMIVIDTWADDHGEEVRQAQGAVISKHLDKGGGA